MKRLLALMLTFLLSAPAIAQTVSDPCLPGPETRSVFDEILKHFLVMEGTVDVRPFERAVPAERYGADVAPAAADFNVRNAASCPNGDAPLTGLRLLAGPQKTRLSRVGFDALAMTAFAEITMIGGPEIGSSHYVILKKAGGTWKVVEERQYRIF